MNSTFAIGSFNEIAGANNSSSSALQHEWQYQYLNFHITQLRAVGLVISALLILVVSLALVRSQVKAALVRGSGHGRQTRPERYLAFSALSSILALSLYVLNSLQAFHYADLNEPSPDHPTILMALVYSVYELFSWTSLLFITLASLQLLQQIHPKSQPILIVLRIMTFVICFATFIIEVWEESLIQISPMIYLSTTIGSQAWIFLVVSLSNTVMVYSLCRSSSSESIIVPGQTTAGYRGPLITFVILGILLDVGAGVLGYAYGELEDVALIIVALQMLFRYTASKVIVLVGRAFEASVVATDDAAREVQVQRVSEKFYYP